MASDDRNDLGDDDAAWEAIDLSFSPIGLAWPQLMADFILRQEKNNAQEPYFLPLRTIEEVIREEEERKRLQAEG